MADWWQELRSRFPLCDRRAYLFAGAQAPLATDVRIAMLDFLELWEDQVWRMEQTEWRSFDEAAKVLGQIFDCDPLRIVAAEGTSHAMNIAAAMVLARWTREGRPRANVVLHHESHTASSFAWVNAVRLGAPLELRWPTPTRGQDAIETLAHAIDEETLAVVTTHVSHTTGERLDVPSLVARFPDRAWAFLLDAAQSAGAISLVQEVAQCDFVGFPAYKWLFGPPGVGFLAVQQSWLDNVGPPFAGWASAEDVWEMNAKRLRLAPGGVGFRLGMPNFIGMAGANEGLRLSLNAGTNRIAERIRLLTDRVLGGLSDRGFPSPTPTDWSRRAGVVCIDAAEPSRVMLRLLQEGIEVGVEIDRIRVDPHAYNSEEEIDRFIERFAELARPKT